MKLIKGFSKLNRDEKIRFIQTNLPLTGDLAHTLQTYRHPQQQKLFDEFSENTLSNYYLPYGVAPNFNINGQIYVVPMVVEESSVVAAASRAAAYWANHGGFKVTIHNTLKAGHIWFQWPGDSTTLQNELPALKRHLTNAIKPITQSMEKRGGGIRDILLIPQPELPDTWQLQVLFNTADSMGANFINTCLEAMEKPLAGYLKDKGLPAPDVIMSILSNHTPQCLVCCEAHCAVEALSSYSKKETPQEFARRFKLAMDIAWHNTDRAVTHNKGIYNGVDAVILATGNDFRAVEAAGHAYAARDGQYRALSTCDITSEGEFHISLTIPMAVGTVGGLTRLHPLANLSMDILQQPTAGQLMGIAAAAGLANNFSAVASLVTTGIQNGHMKLHLSNILNSFNASADEKKAAQTYFSNKTISRQAVKEFLGR